MPRVPLTLHLSEALRRRLEKAAEEDDLPAAFLAERLIQACLEEGRVRATVEYRLVTAALREDAEGRFIVENAMDAFIADLEAGRAPEPPKPA